jgi:hypothetical protein
MDAKRSIINQTRIIESSGSSIYTFVDLIKHRSVRSITFIITLLWIIRYYIYFGQAFALNTLGEDLNSNMMLIAMSEIVASMTSSKTYFHKIRTHSLKTKEENQFGSLFRNCSSFFFTSYLSPSSWYLLVEECGVLLKKSDDSISYGKFNLINPRFADSE